MMGQGGCTAAAFIQLNKLMTALSNRPVCKTKEGDDWHTINVQQQQHLHITKRRQDLVGYW